jgi:type I restriction enzyme S subunit
MQSHSTGIRNLNGDAYKAIEVVYPSLAEQRRIVAILDEAFEGIATAKAHAEKNLRNAREVFEARIRDIFSSPPNGWVECALGDVCEMYQPKTITGKELVTDGPYLVFGANGPIGRYTTYNHEDPEVLVTCRGATCGAVNVSEPKSWVTGNAMVVRPLNGGLDKSFLEHMLRSGVDLSSTITGAAQPQITRTNLAPLLIRFPRELAVQRQLAAEFGELHEATVDLQTVCQSKLAALDELKQSLLHQAFSGQL